MEGEMSNVLALQSLGVESADLGICFSMHSTFSTTSSWDPPAA